MFWAIVYSKDDVCVCKLSIQMMVALNWLCSS